MNLYIIKISSSGYGWTDEKLTCGSVSDKDGTVSISYKLDGDDCELIFDGDKIIQERRGGQYVKITFKEGKTTDCIIGSGGMRGYFDVHTRILKFVSGNGGYSLALEYESGSDGELIRLNFTAIKKR